MTAAVAAKMSWDLVLSTMRADLNGIWKSHTSSDREMPIHPPRPILAPGPLVVVVSLWAFPVEYARRFDEDRPGYLPISTLTSSLSYPLEYLRRPMVRSQLLSGKQAVDVRWFSRWWMTCC